MPKPILINTAMLVQNKSGTYALDLIDEQGDIAHRFELTEQAFLEIKDDALSVRTAQLGSRLVPWRQGTKRGKVLKPKPVCSRCNGTGTVLHPLANEVFPTDCPVCSRRDDGGCLDCGGDIPADSVAYCLKHQADHIGEF